MEIKPVDDHVRAGFAQRMTEQFRAPAIWTTSPDKLSVLKTMLGNRQPEYPYVFLTQQTTSPNLESYSSHRLARYGIPVTYSDDQRQAFYARLIPQNFEVEVTFITNKYDTDLASVDGFSRRWSFARRNGYMQYRVNYGLTSLDIAVVMSETISLPQRENPADTESVYQVVANLTIKGYMSEPELGTRQRILEVQPNVGVAQTVADVGNFFPFPQGN